MTLFLCVDDNYGMLFNGRRQSRDRVLCQRVLDIVKDARLLVNNYSAKLFPEDRVLMTEEPAQIAQFGDFCFVEDIDIQKLLPKVQGLVLYRWNRAYPSDVKFPAELLAEFELIETTDFVGNSHERITEEVYKR